MEEAFRRDFSLKPKDASATIIASAICRHDSFSDRGSAAKTSRTLREVKTILATVFRFTLVPQKSCGWAAKASVEVREVGEQNFSPHLTIPRSPFPFPPFHPYFIGLKCVFGVKKGAGKIFTKLGWRG